MYNFTHYKSQFLSQHMDTKRLMDKENGEHIPERVMTNIDM